MGRAFVSCDWGTTRFRLRWIEDGRPRAEAVTDEGTARLAAETGDRAGVFRAALGRGLERLGAPGALPVVISGMAGSSIGWKELSYARLPFPLDGSGAVWDEVERGVYLLSGLRSDADVMRGEETEVLGAAAGLPGESAIFILPGTHSKHVETAGGAIAGFRTFMTGELFEVLGRHSVLRHSVDPEAEFLSGAFSEGARESRRGPLPATLFRVRTRQVLDRRPPAENASYLSGLLVGAELAALEGERRPIHLCAAGRLREAYEAGARELGLPLRTLPSEGLAARGQEMVLERILGRR